MGEPRDRDLRLRHHPLGTGRIQTDGSRENAPRLLDAEGKFRSALMYPDRTLDGMMIGMRTMMTLGSVLSSPVVADGVVYFGSTDGQVYAVR